MTEHVRNLFEVLGVSVDATPDEIKKAYRRLSKKYHPDTGDEDDKDVVRFTEVVEAYEILKDSVLRKKHLADLEAEFRQRAEEVRRENEAAGRVDEFDDLVGDAFGGPPKPPPNPRSQPRPRPMPPRQPPSATSSTAGQNSPSLTSSGRPPSFASPAYSPNQDNTQIAIALRIGLAAIVALLAILPWVTYDNGDSPDNFFLWILFLLWGLCRILAFPALIIVPLLLFDAARKAFDW